MSARRGHAEASASGGVDHRGRYARVTFALRRCCGCGTTLGICVWPWTGCWFIQTHGLCVSCLDEALVDLEVTHEASRPRRRPAVGTTITIRDPARIRSRGVLHRPMEDGNREKEQRDGR